MVDGSLLQLSHGGHVILRVTNDGEIIWQGKPSQAAEVFKDILGNVIDSKAASAGMRQRTYERACRSILTRAKELSRDELIDFLERSLQYREQKGILLTLQDHKED